MAITIPSYVYTKYNEAVTLVEREITIYYPEKREECPNCYYIDVGGRPRSVSYYKNGGPAPFEDGNPCPYCGGTGSITTEFSEDVPARLYNDPSKWAKQYNIKIQEGTMMTIFNMDYTEKILKCNYMIPKFNGLENYTSTRYYKLSDIFTNSFGLNPIKYSTCFWGKNAK